MNAQTLIQQLQLEPLPEEGGFYRETFRDPGIIPGQSLPQLDGDRSYSTCIYYLITPEEFSGLHKVKSTEIFHFYLGDPVEMVQINEAGHLKTITLGSDLAQNQTPQVIVPPETWQGTQLVGQGQWALLGCTVAPGFDISDFSGGSCTQISKLFPEHTDLIQRYTHC